MTIKAILWDIDGTLILTEQIMDEVLHGLLEELGHPLPADAFDQFLGLTEEEVYNWVIEKTGASLTLEEWKERTVASFKQQLHRASARADVLGWITRFEAAGLQQAAVSNGMRPIVDANLDFLGLEQRFAFSIAAEDTDAPKPNPKPYLVAAERLGLTPEQCVVVEDSPAGCRAGLAAGMTVIAWPEEPGALTFPDGVNLVNDLAEFDWAAHLPEPIKAD
ncbi:MAG: HAD family phosphatase [Alphaproteobacteria bacterium]